MKGKYRVLYIEDDDDSRRLVSRVLSSNGYEVVVAADGLEGMVLARQLHPQIVLMDINLPNLDGRVVTTRLRSLPDLETVPIVALTANNSPGNRERALAAGCTGFLTKPIDVDQFPHQVASFLHGHKHTISPVLLNEHLELHVQDVVAQLEAKVRELEKINDRLYRLDRLKSDFITLASHELRTPLTLVSGYGQLLEAQLTHLQTAVPGDEAANPLQSAQKLNQGIERLSRVIDEVIGVSRIATNRLDLYFAPITLSEIVTEILAELAPILQERAIQLSLDGLETLPMIRGDAGHIKTAVANIIENAIKFTPDGGQIILSGEHKKGAVILSVRDTGIGIPPSEQPFIFDQFYIIGSIDNHSSSRYGFMGGGLGLGLAVTRGIIEAHNGRVWVESEKRDPDSLPGSTFHLLFPIS